MTKQRDRSPAMQFYFRQFTGDENVKAMDLDTIGAHILLMCYAGASPDGYRIGNNPDRIRRTLGIKSDENFQRIWHQLLEGAWKISDDGKFIEQHGMLRTLKKQKDFSRLQRQRALKRYEENEPAEVLPDDCRNDAEPLPEACSSSTSTSASTNNRKVCSESGDLYTFLPQIFKNPETIKALSDWKLYLESIGKTLTDLQLENLLVDWIHTPDDLIPAIRWSITSTLRTLRRAPAQEDQEKKKQTRKKQTLTATLE